MSLFKKMDLWSITDGLDEVMNYCFEGNERDSQFWDYYSDQINEMSIIASDMWNELMELKQKISYELPYKEIEFCEEDECNKTGIAWFNSAACMLSDTDMVVLLENENVYDSDIYREKEKRIKALERLTKKQQLYLYTEVIGFITRYLELRNAFETITAVIRELEYHQSFVIKSNGEIEMNKAAYL